MKTLQMVLKEIAELTGNLETNYPEVYTFLDENPMTIPAINHPDMDKAIMLEYLEGLKQLLKHYEETHKHK